MIMLEHIFFGIIARIINLFISVRPKYWAFGSDRGKTYCEGAKYLLEYALSHHPDYKCIFVAQSRETFNNLKKKGIPCVMNFSLKGIYEIAKCEAIFTTQSFADIRYAFRKRNRKYYYLVHGMPFKKAWNQLPKDYAIRLTEGNSIFMKLKDRISGFWTLGCEMSDVDFLSACSPFLAKYMQLDFGPNYDIRVLGMPRNDALFQPERMKNEKWVDGIRGKIVITYMPTHRGYGTGEATPTPFKNRPDIQQWMRKNNIVLLMKNHPNMIPKLKDVENTDVIKDITKLRLDPQVCIYHTDILITDYSSVWMDFLLLRRPILFYIYDNFDTDDVGTYYDLKTANVGHFCYNEDELFNLIKACRQNSKGMIASDEILDKYHTYVDGNSCQRYFKAVTESLNEE